MFEGFSYQTRKEKITENLHVLLVVRSFVIICMSVVVSLSLLWRNKVAPCAEER